MALVYILNKDNKPLMPTRRCGFVRRALRDGRAEIALHEPFTIRLLYEAEGNVQPVDLGVDAGSGHVGLSACTDKKELFASEVLLRSDITKLLSERRAFRRARRSRKTRYRKKRFDNRVRGRHKGWLAPSVENRIHAHIRAVGNVCRILPVSKIKVETASFDLQKLKADLAGLSRPRGTDYQQGDMLGFWNAREYVLFRDGHTCRCCKGKSRDKRLNVHHIESRRAGGNAPDNLVTLCKTCHGGYHKGTVKLPKDIKRGKKTKDAVFMGIMRWTFYKRLKELYGEDMVRMTYGYITKNTRIKHRLKKTHAVDARCISGHPDAKPCRDIIIQKKVRRHNRKLHRAKSLKGGVRKPNQSPREVFGFRLFDKVKYGQTVCFVYGRRASGAFDIRLIDGTKVHAGISHRKLKQLSHSDGTLTERRPADRRDGSPPTTKGAGVRTV